VIELDSHRLFAGRYRIVGRIAAGGMGAVFEVVHVETQRRRALKVMLPEFVANRELRERFQMEARVTANVYSEYIVDVFDAGVDESTGMPFLVMELLQGEELGAYLNRVGAIPALDAVAYLRQVGSALDKTHAAGIVHRDLKPENLFLTHREDGTPRIKILDFGISKVVDEARTGNATRSLGTPLYMAPEQVLGQNVSPATDLYSLGLIAYALLVGESYWQCDTGRFDNAIAFALHTTSGTTESAVARAARAGRTLPPGFDHWFRRATRLDPSQRFQRASEMVSELSSALIGGGAPAAATPPPVMHARTVVLQSAVAASAPGSIGTAPGTEIDRSEASSGVTKFRKRSWFLLLGAAAAVTLAGAVGLHSMHQAPALITAIAESAATATVKLSTAASVVPAAAPSVNTDPTPQTREEAKAAALVSAAPASAVPSVSPKPFTHASSVGPKAKAVRPTQKSIAPPSVQATAEPSPAPVHASATPYTRD
jgi:eukaryotic-like serine/threonine-protein kinase